MSALKSTIVRTQMALMRGAFGIADRLSPPLAARQALRLWLRIPHAKNPSGIGGDAFTLDVDGTRVHGETVGSGPIVLLVHGWGGHRGQLAGFVAPLVESGFTVAAIDAPSHGSSAPGNHGPDQTDFIEMGAALQAAIDHLGQPTAVIAHSAGSALIGRALRHGLQLDRLVLVAPMASPTRYFPGFQEMLGLREESLELFIDRLVERTGVEVAEFDPVRLPTGRHPRETLVVHDRDDRETSWQDGADIANAWPNARLLSTNGLGHRRILTDPSVIAEVTGYLTAAHDRSRVARRPQS